MHTFNIERYGHLSVLICSLQISYHFQTEKAGVFSLLGRALFSCLALCVFVAFVSQLCSSGCYHRISLPPVQQQTTADQIGSYVFILGVWCEEQKPTPLFGHHTGRKLRITYCWTKQPFWFYRRRLRHRARHSASTPTSAADRYFDWKYRTNIRIYKLQFFQIPPW